MMKVLPRLSAEEKTWLQRTTSLLGEACPHLKNIRFRKRIAPLALRVVKSRKGVVGAKLAVKISRAISSTRRYARYSRSLRATEVCHMPNGEVIDPKECLSHFVTYLAGCQKMTVG